MEQKTKTIIKFTLTQDIDASS